MILFIDCYDSFSYNLTRLIESALSTEVKVVHNDQVNTGQLTNLLRCVEAVVLGPGPGNPHNEKDRGIVGEIWNILAENPVPTFGICFGYQSMVLAHGGIVTRLNPPQHGRVGLIDHDGSSRLLKGIPSPFEAVRYHSLHCVSRNAIVCTAVDSITTPEAPVEMAAEHKSLPFFGVQFHPESVLSKYGKRIFENFWEVVVEYNKTSRQILPDTIPQSMLVTHTPLQNPSSRSRNNGVDLKIYQTAKLSEDKIAQFLRGNMVVFKSASYPGEWTIIGVLEPCITPHLRAKNGIFHEGPLNSPPRTSITNANFWEQAAAFMSSKLLPLEVSSSLNHEAKLPFLGGLIGYVSYEGACEHTVNDGSSPIDSGLNSDFSMVFVSKSFLINENTGKSYLVGSKDWTEKTYAHFIDDADHDPVGNADAISNSQSDSSLPFHISKPKRALYDQSFGKCREALLAGDSYELCLTTQTELKLNSGYEDLLRDPWKLFTHLTKRNPAPYCSYMTFDDMLIATSPERFMSWNHEKCEFRPIKGTVRKSASVTKDIASSILRSPKEQAENLMIVDLIRHDLGHLLYDVSAPQLMAIEEYHSVYQLVTSIEGRFQRNGAAAKASGIDVLSQSLPPGSMTGAPKRRSVEILRQIEQKPRGIYSGVHGYWSIDDRGDWSVVIRSLFRSKDDPEDLWRLGAGGAVTVLSTVDGEYDEMIVKLDAVLGALRLS